MYKAHKSRESLIIKPSTVFFLFRGIKLWTGFGCPVHIYYEV